MEKETCDGCGAEFEKGSLARDQNGDASQLRCEKCIKPGKKPRKPRKRKEIPVITTVAAPPNVVSRQDPEPQIDLGVMTSDAEVWAKECGLGKVRVQGPNRETFPQYGFGYTFQIMEVGGKERKATARYTSAGARNFWTIDGMVTG